MFCLLKMKNFNWELFLKALSANGLTQNSFARKAGLNPGTVANFKKTKHITKTEIINAIEQTLNIRYEDLCDNTVKTHSKTRKLQSFWPILGDAVTGECIEKINNLSSFLLADEYIQVKSYSEEIGYGLKIIGDSMSPVLPEGSLIAVSPNAEVKNGDIAVIFVKSEISAYQCEVCVKLFHWRGAESQEAVLTSYNPAYKEIILPRSSIVKLHKVVQSLVFY